ncbi:Transposon protein [Arachis hypogaea]|nr:Transposon protein [Arachis hypogaea]
MESYKRTYAFNVNPVKGQDLWEKTPSPAPVPPSIKPKPGRPTTKRRKDKNEGPSGTRSKMKRKYNPIRCMFCGEGGHNRRNCPKKKQIDVEEQARHMQLQLAVETVPRPSKLKVVKGRAREKSSPQAVATSTASFSAETIRGTSSATAKRLADFMTLVPTPGFKPPRKKDKPT